MRAKFSSLITGTVSPHRKEVQNKRNFRLSRRFVCKKEQQDKAQQMYERDTPRHVARMAVRPRLRTSHFGMRRGRYPHRCVTPILADARWWLEGRILQMVENGWRASPDGAVRPGSLFACRRSLALRQSDLIAVGRRHTVVSNRFRS